MDKLNLIQKLIEVRKEVKYLTKEKQMQSGQKYNYVGAEDVYCSVRTKMDEIGVYLKTEILDASVTHGANNNGSATYFTEVKMQMTWINADDPEDTLVSEWYAQGTDTAGEKGVGKALTYGGKYFIMSQFQIATGKDDPDGIAPPDTQAKQLPKQTIQPQQTQQSQPAPQPVEEKTVIDGTVITGMVKALAKSEGKERDDVIAFLKTSKLDDVAHVILLDELDEANDKDSLSNVYTIINSVSMTSKQRQALTAAFVKKRSSIK